MRTPRLVDRTVEERQDDIDYYAKLPLKELRKRQDIVISEFACVAKQRKECEAHLKQWGRRDRFNEDRLAVATSDLMITQDDLARAVSIHTSGKDCFGPLPDAEYMMNMYNPGPFPEK